MELNVDGSLRMVYLVGLIACGWLNVKGYMYSKSCTTKLIICTTFNATVSTDATDYLTDTI